MFQLQTVEALERRQFLSASVRDVQPAHDLVEMLGTAQPPSPALTPFQVRTAYGFNRLSLSGVTGTGIGQTIAIVDAYDNPNFSNTGSADFVNSDLHKFDVAFGLPDPPSFIKVNQRGETSLPAVDNRWALEIALDVEWAHAMAPAANIVLVEADSPNVAAIIGKAVDYVRSRSDVSVISMSFGIAEYADEISLDPVFQTPANHQGVTFVAATGDFGTPGEYPAYSANVVAVGATTLYIDHDTGAYVSELGWGHGPGSIGIGGSGGGISSYIDQPAYQESVVTQSTTRRTIPDLSMVGDPYTGAAVYDSLNGGAATPWFQVGGTSFSAPLFASTVAITNEARAASGFGPLDGPRETLPRIYSILPANFHDIIAGNNGPSTSASPGYDLVTGRGSPIANLFIDHLAANDTPLLGDANRDNVVDTLDFTILGRNFGRTDATLNDGDFNYDRTINAVDYDAICANFGARAVVPASLFGAERVVHDSVSGLV